MNADWKNIHSGFSQYLKENGEKGTPSSLYDPVNYIMNLGGKYMRPMLLLAACKMVGGDWKSALPAALGIEMFHNFTLAHDDIMDEALMRRGKPALHIQYDTNQAILSGDVMMLRSLEWVQKSLDSNNFVTVTQDFLQTGISICEGQQLDVDFEKQTDTSISDYIDMIRGKTGVLPAEGLRMGAYIGGASTEIANKFYEFGIELGLAFQIQDDILDAYGDPEKVGKISGGDIRQNKKSILYILAMEQGDDVTRQALVSLYSTEDKSDEKVDKVKALWNSCGALKAAEELKESHHHRSQDILTSLKDQSRDVVLLEYISDLLLNRKS